MLTKAKALTPELVRLRRDIHRHPELSFQEVRTAQLVADTLNEIGGITVRTGIAKTGVVAEMGTGPGPTIAIRADMDALPIEEKTGATYASIRAGVMHACGHDAHTAILLGVAHLLKESFARDGLPGSVRLIFQPAEEQEDIEGKSGGLRMVEENVMEGVDAIIALHVDSTEALGTISSQAGWNSAAVDSFKAWLTGSGGHGAYPHEATDPLWLLGPVLTALHGIVSRRIDPTQPAVVSLGQIHGGTANNILPPEVYLHGTLRSYNEQVRVQLIAEVERALSIVRPLGGDYRLQIINGYPAGWNDPTVNGWLTAVSAEFLGSAAVREEPMGMGAEDFAYMSQRVPGAMIMVGAAIPDNIARHHHTNIFDINEEVLPLGTAILAETARRFLAGEISL